MLEDKLLNVRPFVCPSDCLSVRPSVRQSLCFSDRNSKWGPWFCSAVNQNRSLIFLWILPIPMSFQDITFLLICRSSYKNVKVPWFCLFFVLYIWTYILRIQFQSASQLLTVIVIVVFNPDINKNYYWISLCFYASLPVAIIMFAALFNINILHKTKHSKSIHYF